MKFLMRFWHVVVYVSFGFLGVVAAFVLIELVSPGTGYNALLEIIVAVLSM